MPVSPPACLLWAGGGGRSAQKAWSLTGWCRQARCPHTLLPCPGPQPQLAPSPEQAGALREVRGRVGISCDTLSPKPRKPRDGAGPDWDASRQRGLLPHHTRARGGWQKPGRGVQLGSTLCLQVSTQPSAGKMTSLPSPVGRVQPAHTISPRDWAGDRPSGGLQPWPATSPLASPWPHTSTPWSLGCGGYLLPSRCLSRAPRFFSEALPSVGRQPDPHPTVQPGGPRPTATIL